MKREAVQDFGAIFGWVAGSLIISVVLYNMTTIPASFGIMFLILFVYGLFSLVTKWMTKDLYDIGRISNLYLGIISFFASLLSPLVATVIIIVIAGMILLFLVFSPFFHSSVEFEFLKKDWEKDMSFLGSFHDEAWKRLHWDETDLQDSESSGACDYNKKKDAFSVVYYGDVNGRTIKKLKSFALKWGYTVSSIKTID